MTVVPNVEFGYENVHFTAKEIAERQAVISQNSKTYLDDWRSGKVDPGLTGRFEYQQDAFEALLKFTHETGLVEQPSIDEIIIPSGYLDEPPAWGKTALMAKYMGAIGIGTLPTPESPMPLRGLVATYAQYAVKQTAGALDVSRGLKKFLPDLDITMCFAEHKKLTGSASVITYRMLLLLATAGLLDNYYADVVLGDEAHNLLGQETKKLWKPFAKNKRSIGLTGSPEYSPSKKISQLFEHKIHGSTMRANVEAGNVSAVQVLGFATGSEIAEPAAGVEDFSDAHLEPLMLDPRRNRAICDVAAQLIMEGRRGIINAIPGVHKGETLFHPRLLAKALDGREIEDEFGNKRYIKAAAIGTHITPKECEKILEDFKQDKYDVVVQVDKVNESYDDDDVAFAINAAPTLSPVRAIQRNGRLMRKSEQWPLKIIIEIIDDIKGSRIPYTAWHVLGEREMMKQGQIFAPPELIEIIKTQEKKGSKGGGGGGAKKRPLIAVPDPDAFNELLRAMHKDYALRVVDSFTLKAKEGYGPPRPGWRELPTVVAEKYGNKSLGIDGIRGVLERAGKAAEEDFCELAQGSRGPTYFVSPNGEAFLLGYEFPKPVPSSQWKTERELAEVLDTTRDIIRRCSEGLPRTIFLARRINREHEHFGPEAIQVLKQKVAKVKEQEEKAQKLTSSRDLAAEPEVAWSRTSVDYFLSSHYGIGGEKLKNPGTGPEARFYTDDEANLVRRHRRHRYQVPQKKMNEGNVIDLETATGRTREEILAAAQALKIEHRECDDGRENDEINHVIYDGRYRDKEGAYAYSELTSPQVAEQITAYLEEVGDALVIPPKPEPAPKAASAPEPQAPAKPKPAPSAPPEPPKPPTLSSPPAPEPPKPSPPPESTVPVEAVKPSSPAPADTRANKPKIPPQVTFMVASAPDTQPKPEPKTEPEGGQKPPTAPAPPASPAPPTSPKEPARSEAEPVPERPTPPRELAAKTPTPPVVQPPVKNPSKPRPPIDHPVTKRVPAPIPDKKPEPKKEENYLDILTELASLEAPCEEGAVRQVAQACGILRDIKRDGRRMVATDDVILKLATHISKLYKAPAFMKTAPQIAEHHGLTMDELASIVANLSSVNTSAMVEVYRTVDAEGKMGPAAVHMKPQLQALIERAVQSRRLIPKARDPRRGRRK